MTPLRNLSAESHLWLLPAVLALVCSIPYPGSAAQGHGARVSAAPGTLVRWSAPGTKRCSMSGRSWPALQETCYYPVDLLQKPGLIKITRWGRGPGESAHISVEPHEHPGLGRRRRNGGGRQGPVLPGERRLHRPRRRPHQHVLPPFRDQGEGGTADQEGRHGRSTGPHLFFGVRWHGARINPHFLLEDPAKIPAVGP